MVVFDPGCRRLGREEELTASEHWSGSAAVVWPPSGFVRAGSKVDGLEIEDRVFRRVGIAVGLVAGHSISLV